ncbi:hypothetical protein [Kitasatospora paranensis]|uniref:DUF4034 domain-containing protein n=1 Tax=Kitasatospora paranensis TaxID=258053 RepID=A0ABW2FV67_9ACTN
MSTASSASAVVFDPAAAIPELAAARQAAQRGDWPAVAGLFAACPEEYGLLVLADEVAKTHGIEALLGQVLAHRPGDPLATCLLADHHIHLGWQARTSRSAKDVTPEGWRAFRHHLNLAEQLLIGAVARDRGNALAWVLRLTVSRGLSLGTSETRRRHRALTRVAPHHYAGRRGLLQQLLPKWGGSWEDAHAFAVEGLHTAPAGSLAGAVVATYHVERMLAITQADRAAYAQRADVRGELAAAAAASVLHPTCRARYGLITAHSTFAMLAATGGHWTAAKAHFEAMGPYGSTDPWDMLPGDAERHFLTTRRDAVQKG